MAHITLDPHTLVQGLPSLGSAGHGFAGSLAWGASRGLGFRVWGFRVRV